MASHTFGDRSDAIQLIEEESEGDGETYMRRAGVWWRHPASATFYLTSKK